MVPCPQTAEALGGAPDRAPLTGPQQGWRLAWRPCGRVGSAGGVPARPGAAPFLGERRVGRAQGECAERAWLLS